ncbi:MAG: lamin tail domain-containing protein, partial [Clostridia bacterium]|nr:lamin tail domain-containing protein [Clostridia bacterium]
AQGGARRPAARPAPAAPSGERKSALPGGFWPLAGVCALVLAAGLLLQGLMPNGFVLSDKNGDKEMPVAAQVSEIHGDGPVRLNEIMTANGGVLVDSAGQTPDWAEVANISNRPVNLSGYVLAKNAKAGNVFVFPELILQPGECAVVYADSTLLSEPEGELHAPFRLSSGGDVLMLFNTADVAVDTVNIPALGENEAYVRQSRDAWSVSGQPTPGMLNTEENYRAMTSVTQGADVQLAEIVASNTQYAPDENGVCQDYVLLRNTSAQAVDIGGWYLSDNPGLPRLWKFPAGVVIPGGGALAVHCSGLNRLENPSHLHTSFRLSSEGETVTLSNAAGQPVDTVTYDLLKTDAACVRGADGSWSIGTPTL